MPFLRITRDKRGYEYFALVHTTSGRRGKVRQRILYWFRTPPNVKVGRPPIDDEAMRALEAQYPDVTFDWDSLRNTPMPPPSAEHWRERRLAEKAMRQVRAGEEEAETPVEEEQIAVATASANPPEPRDQETQVAPSTAAAHEEAGAAGSAPQIADAAGDVLQPDAAPNPRAGGEPGSGSEPRHRRRRRRGRRGRPPGQPQVTGGPEPNPTEAPAVASMKNDSDELSGEEPGSGEDP